MVTPQHCYGRPASREEAIATLSWAMAAVCEVYGCTTEDILGMSRKPEVAEPRMVLMWLAVTRYRLSMPAAGRAIGGRHHTTVLHAKRRIDDLLVTSYGVRFMVGQIDAKLAKRQLGEAA